MDAPNPGPRPPAPAPAPAPSPPRPHFFISRFASTDQHSRYIHRAVQSIRRFHPDAPVTVVDDHSPPGFEYSPPAGDARAHVVRNPYPRSGELGTLRVAWQQPTEPGAILVVMHDSMALRGPVSGLPPGEDLAFLWHFARYGHMHLPQSLRLLSRLALPPDELLRVAWHFLSGFGRTWRGCFGMAVATTRAALQRIQAASGLFSDELMRSVASREDRQAAERIVALLAQAYARREPRSAPIPSLCDDIFLHPEPWGTRTAPMDLDALLASAPQYRAPFLKSWSGR